MRLMVRELSLEVSCESDQCVRSLQRRMRQREKLAIQLRPRQREQRDMQQVWRIWPHMLGEWHMHQLRRDSQLRKNRMPQFKKRSGS